jgi:hypothetical protein
MSIQKEAINAEHAAIVPRMSHHKTKKITLDGSKDLSHSIQLKAKTKELAWNVKTYSHS